MIRFIFSLSLLFTFLTVLAQSKARKAIFIIVDGIPADVIEGSDLPNLKKIAGSGGMARSLVGGDKGKYSESPTISAVGYNSILTGTWINKHNVKDNDIVSPNYNYPTIFRLLKMQDPQKKIGIFSSWQDNRTKLTGDAMPETGNISFDYKLDGLELDTLNYPHDARRDFMHRIDERITDEAAQTIRTYAPDLSWVYLEYTDDMGHAHGDSPEFNKAVKYADMQVGRIYDAIEYREKNFNEDWLIIITTDHGRDSATGRHHGGQSAREKTGWIVTNAKELNDRFKNQQSSIVDILPTIARFMGIHIPAAISKEIDGVPLIGKLSVSEPSAIYNNGKAIITWKAGEKNGKVKIWITTTNHFKTGGSDTYYLIKEIPLQSQKAVVDLKKYPAGFYKIIIEGTHNVAGTWLLAGNK